MERATAGGWDPSNLKVLQRSKKKIAFIMRMNAIETIINN
jgi:hypothetical protein